MPADEVTHGTDVDESRVRSGPRHAAPRKPLFTRFHMPAGKAIAMAAMPTAVLVGMGFTSSLALAAGNGSPSPTAKSLTADEYKDCVAAVGGASASPSPSASQSTAAGKATPSPSSTADASKDSSKTSSKNSSGSGTSSSSSSPDSGSGDKATPTPSATDGSGKSTSSGDTASPSPSASSGGGGLLSGVGDALGSLLGGGSSSTTSTTPSATASPSASASKDTSASATSGKSLTGTVKDTAKKVTDTVNGTVKDTTDTVSKTTDAATKAAQKAADAATATASPSPSPSADAGNCPTATADQGGVDNKVPVADDPWYLSASSLLLKGADYQGVVQVRTANGTTKKVLKYVISGGTDIGDLHQTVKDKQQGKTYHVQAGSGTTSTIRDGDTTMYTESISGNLFGLIPITFSPDSPPPLNIPLIYFTNVKVVQAAQFGGTLHVPGMHVYTTDGTG